MAMSDIFKESVIPVVHWTLLNIEFFPKKLLHVDMELLIQIRKTTNLSHLFSEENKCDIETLRLLVMSATSFASNCSLESSRQSFQFICLQRKPPLSNKQKEYLFMYITDNSSIETRCVLNWLKYVINTCPCYTSYFTDIKMKLINAKLVS